MFFDDLRIIAKPLPQCDDCDAERNWKGATIGSEGVRLRGAYKVGWISLEVPPAAGT